jgi:hypothetical protein
MADKQPLTPAPKLAATNKAHFPNESPEYRAARNALLAEEIELRRHLERVGLQPHPLQTASGLGQTSSHQQGHSGKSDSAGNRMGTNISRLCRTRRPMPD